MKCILWSYYAWISKFLQPLISLSINFLIYPVRQSLDQSRDFSKLFPRDAIIKCYCCKLFWGQASGTVIKMPAGTAASHIKSGTWLWVLAPFPIAASSWCVPREAAADDSSSWSLATHLGGCRLSSRLPALALPHLRCCRHFGCKPANKGYLSLSQILAPSFFL